MSSAWSVCQCPQQGLFEDIAEGLRHARVMIACVSTEYAKSDNCAMEFRFATSILKIPTLLAVVGTDNTWRLSQVATFRKQTAAKQHLQYETLVNGVLCCSNPVYEVI